MLQNIRDRSQSWISIIIIGFLIVMFALWGISYYLGGSALSQQSVAKVNGHDVPLTQFRETYGRLRQQEASLINNGLITTGQLKQKALKQLVLQTALYQRATNAGLGIDTNAIDQYIAQMPVFQKDGKFSESRFKTYLQNQGLTTAGMRQRLSASLIINQWQIGLMNSGFILPNEVSHLLSLAHQKRSIHYAVISAKPFAGSTKVSESEIEAYYKAHPKTFTAPKKVKLAYLSLTLGDIAKNIHTTPDEVQAYYQANISQYKTPEQRRVSMILIPESKSNPQAAKWQADKIEAGLKAGRSFSDLAKKYSADPVSAKKGGDLGWLKLNSQPLSKALFKLKQVGDVSEPIKTSYGLQILKYTGLKPAKQKSFAQVKQQVATRLKRTEAEKKYASRGNDMANITFQDPTSLKQAAKQLNLTVQTTGWVTPKGAKSGIASNPQVLKVAFSDNVLVQGNNSDPININSEHAVVIRVIKHEPAKLKPLSDVKAQITTILSKQQAMADAKKSADQALKDLQAGKEPASFKSETISRTNKTLPGPVVDAAFTLNIPSTKQVSAKVVAVKGKGYALVQLNSVTTNKVSEAQALEAKSAVSRLMAITEYLEYQQTVESQAKVTEKADLSDD